MGFHPMFLDQYAGEWYGVLYGGYYNRSQERPGQDWGDLEGPLGQWAIKLIDGRWQLISMSRLPDVFQKPNIMLLSGEPNEHEQFAGHRVTLAHKAAWSEKHPPTYVSLERPTATSPKRPDALPVIIPGKEREH
jgi:hypothetical protein